MTAILISECHLLRTLYFILTQNPVLEVNTHFLTIAHNPDLVINCLYERKGSREKNE